MLKCYEFQCRNQYCNHVFTDYVNTNDQKDGELIIVKCPKCSEDAVMQIGNPAHHTHLSWSTWRK